jgi:hypothetical protein
MGYANAPTKKIESVCDTAKWVICLHLYLFSTPDTVHNLSYLGLMTLASRSVPHRRKHAASA